jgi:hypothetical protein
MMRAAGVILIVLAELAVGLTLLLPPEGDRIHTVRNGSRMCVFTRNRAGRIFPADAGACDGLDQEQLRRAK